MNRAMFFLALSVGLSAQHEIPTTARGPVGAERSGLQPGELRETGSCTVCEQPSKGASMAPSAGEMHNRSTANRHRSKCWPEQRAHLAGSESFGGARFAGRPSTGIRQFPEGRATAYRADVAASVVRTKAAAVADENVRAMTSLGAGWWKRHLADTAMHLGATSADIATSRGLPELNPLLRDSRGHFGARGIVIKLAIFGGIEAAKWTVARRYPRERWVRSLSLMPAAMYAGAALHNARVR